MNRTLISILCTTVILVGCAAGNQYVKQISTDSVEELIVINKTRYDDLTTKLGEPQNIRLEEDGTKVAEYKWVRSRPSAKNFIPLNPVDEFIFTEKTLQVWLKDDVVQRHDLNGVFYVKRVPLIGSDTIHSMRELTEDELNNLVDPIEEANEAVEASQAK